MIFKNKNWYCNKCASDDIIEYGYGEAYSNECQVCGNIAEDVWEMAIHKDTQDKSEIEKLNKIREKFYGKTKEEIKNIIKGGLNDH